MDLLLATRSPNKAAELRELTGQAFGVIDLSSFPENADPEEAGRTSEENAILKAIAASKQLPSLVIADDSGLEVDALGGAPGVFSARYAGENAGDGSNGDILLRELRKQNIATEKGTARFRGVTALAQEGKLLGVFEGFVEGKIVDPPSVSAGVGDDVIFEPKCSDETCADR